MGFLGNSVQNASFISKFHNGNYNIALELKNPEISKIPLRIEIFLDTKDRRIYHVFFSQLSQLIACCVNNSAGEMTPENFFSKKELRGFSSSEITLYTAFHIYRFPKSIYGKNILNGIFQMNFWLYYIVYIQQCRFSNSQRILF